MFPPIDPIPSSVASFTSSQFGRVWMPGDIVRSFVHVGPLTARTRIAWSVRLSSFANWQSSPRLLPP